MIPYYCPNGHENPSGSRFCLHCGEKLALPVSKSIYPGLILGDRYWIVRQLGQGGFGRTYLAKDTNRFDEPCVLKEFAPQIQSHYVLQKAEELFEREAGVLYKLQHPQIPRFRELFRANINTKEFLFLVQDYVEGQTYSALLDARKQQGLRFSEVEVSHLLFQILPVLDYIHSLGVIHRDISPDNLILRSSDSLPVLIDFGGVKRLAATVISEFAEAADKNGSSATLLGKAGYAPQEQIKMGMVYPHSDLYALAVTMLVLLTGKEPQELIDDYTLTWKWQQEVDLSPTLGAVLNRMLALKMGDRYQSASEVMQALTNTLSPSAAIITQLPTPQNQEHSTNLTKNITNAYSTQLATFTTVTPAKYNRQLLTPGKILLIFLLLAGASGVGRWAANSWLNYQAHRPIQNTVTSPPQKPPENIAPKITQQPTPAPQFSSEEKRRKEQLRTRRQQLGIANKIYTELVNQVFWEKYPHQQGRVLSNNPGDAAWRAEWDTMAAQLLNRLELLSPTARQRLGNYTARDRNRWQAEVNKRHVSNSALYDIVDAAFFHLFPQQRHRNFMNQPIRQVWYALAEDKIKPVATLGTFRRVVFEPGASSKQVNGNLKPGQGRVHIVEFSQGEFIKLNLHAYPSILLSIYSPTGKTSILEDSSDRNWQWRASESGFYEIVVVSTGSMPVDYLLNITLEKPIANALRFNIP